MKKVLIFGISGFVGAYLAKEFEQHGYQVYGSDITDGNKLFDSIIFKKAELLDYEAVSSLIKETLPDIIINLAAISSVGLSWSMPQATISVNVIGTLNIMEAARQCREIPKIMLVGSSEEYEVSDKPVGEAAPLNANNPYGISKLTQERFAQLYREHYGMKIYCVRPFNHTGAGQKETFVLPSFCRQVADIAKSGREGIIKVGNLSAERDFSDVRDIVRGYRMILEQGDCNTIYNIGSGVAHSIKELLDYIISLCPQKVLVETDPERYRPVDTPRICCDNSKICSELGWKPDYDIFHTLKEMYDYYVCGEK
ncbi:MAG: GDP-mannose 4,6-dehydratase [Clostridium sp.]|nr:GDP-mannose 4,6-dehydratase [Clostridium sp.]